MNVAICFMISIPWSISHRGHIPKPGPKGLEFCFYILLVVVVVVGGGGGGGVAGAGGSFLFCFVLVWFGFCILSCSACFTSKFAPIKITVRSWFTENLMLFTVTEHLRGVSL